MSNAKWYMRKHKELELTGHEILQSTAWSHSTAQEGQRKWSDGTSRVCVYVRTDRWIFPDHSQASVFNRHGQIALWSGQLWQQSRLLYEQTEDYQIFKSQTGRPTLYQGYNQIMEFCACLWNLLNRSEPSELIV